MGKPITEDAVLQFMREDAYKPLTVQELEAAFGITTAKEFTAFVKLLNRLEDEGKVVRTRTNRYGVPERMNLVRGRLEAHAKGFAFVIPDEPGEPDIYVHPNDVGGAMHGDKVLVRIEKRAGAQRAEGVVVRVLQRANTDIVGTYVDKETYGLVIPDDRRLTAHVYIPKEKSRGAVEGHKVVVRITRYPDATSDPEGEVREILGHKNDPGVDILSIIRRYDLPEAFPEEVLEEAEAIPDTIDPKELEGRRDLRDKKMVTIDGADAKDLDDAVSVERLPNGNYLLGVHIADVSYYVKEGSALDREAYRRGTSVYLVDRVIPMLPHRLSNGICSLNPRVDRLTISCEMEIDAETAEVVRYEIFPSVIRTNERMTYDAVRRILVDNDPELIERYEDLVDDFRLMEELARKLRQKRMERGAIDFDFQEAKILVDEQGKPIDVQVRPRTIAEQIIEEFMLKANETVAEHFYWLRVPFIYRVHEDPDPEKMQAFLEFVSTLGYVVRGKADKIHPRALQQLLEAVKGTPEEQVISTVMLRSMKQARYEAECRGHFGLSTPYYTHFTSPIRRYPDLIVHRMIRRMWEKGGVAPEEEEALHERMRQIAEHSSERERIAVDAERETEDLKKAEYMLERIGEEFDAVVSSVTSFGLFVRLPNTIEGLVHISYLTDDYYHFHEKHLALVGERTGNVFRIGDAVRVRVLNVNVDEHTIDFELVGMERPAWVKKKAPRVIDATAIEVGRRGKKKGRNGRRDYAPAPPRKTKAKGKGKAKKKKAGAKKKARKAKKRR